MKRPMVWILVMLNKHDQWAKAFVTEEQAWQSLHGYVLDHWDDEFDYWDDESDGGHPVPEKRFAAIEMYFRHSKHESYFIRCAPIQGGDPASIWMLLAAQTEAG